MQTNQAADRRAAVLVGSAIMLVLCIWLATIRWHDIKGSCLMNTDSLVMEKGTITCSSRYYKRGSKGPGGWHYAIEYAFAVKGKTYRSSDVTFGYTGASDPDFAESYLRKYPVGKPVVVYYEKNNPAFSVLEPDFKERSLMMIPIGFVLSLVAFVWALIASLAAYIKQSPPTSLRGRY